MTRKESNEPKADLDARSQDSDVKREELLDNVVDLTLNLFIKDNPNEMIDEMGRVLMELFPIRSMIIYDYFEESEEFTPRVVFGYPEERAKKIKEKVIYKISDLGKMDKIEKPLGRFSSFFPAELMDKTDVVRERLTTLNQDEIDLPRKDKNSWHALDRLDIMLADRSGKEIGDISITSTTTGQLIDDENIFGIEIFASIGSVALELAKLRGKELQMAEAQEKRSSQISQLLSITSLILTTTEPSKLLDRILDLIKELFGFKSAAIALYDESEGCFRWRALRGYSEKEMKKALNIRMSREIIKEDLKPEHRIGYLAHFTPVEKLVRDDVKQFFYPKNQMKKALQDYETPRKSTDSWHPLDDLNFSILDRKGKIIGVLSPDKPAGDKIPNREEIEVIEIFVSLVAIALENANLYSETLTSRDEIHILNRLMFHDLMNYNMAIGGYIDLALASDEEERHEFVEKALSQIELITELIDKIRKLSMIRSSDKKNLIRIDLGRTIRNQASKSASLFPLKKVEFSFDFGKIDSFVKANDLLPDLFHNIFINAIKFDIHDKVRIEVNLSETEEEIGGILGKYWKVSITDHGPGIPDERKEMIFLESARLTEPSLGMGLGLSIVKSLVYLYGGKAWVEDRVTGTHENGAIFIVQLPAA